MKGSKRDWIKGLEQGFKRNYPEVWVAIGGV
jgi:hypothetical protein